MEQETIEHLVTDILLQKPSCREDDFLLICEVYKKTVPRFRNMTFAELCRSHNDVGAVAFESITRARRKVQSDNPALKSSQAVTAYRSEKEREYRNYYGTGKEL